MSAGDYDVQASLRKYYAGHFPSKYASVYQKLNQMLLMSLGTNRVQARSRLRHSSIASSMTVLQAMPHLN